MSCAPSWDKAHFRLGSAYAAAKRYLEALHPLAQACWLSKGARLGASALAQASFTFITAVCKARTSTLGWARLQWQPSATLRPCALLHRPACSAKARVCELWCIIALSARQQRVLRAGTRRSSGWAVRSWQPSATLRPCNPPRTDLPSQQRCMCLTWRKLCLQAQMLKQLPAWQCSWQLYGQTPNCCTATVGLVCLQGTRPAARPSELRPVT